MLGLKITGALGARDEPESITCSDPVMISFGSLGSTQRERNGECPQISLDLLSQTHNSDACQHTELGNEFTMGIPYCFPSQPELLNIHSNHWHAGPTETGPSNGKVPWFCRWGYCTAMINPPPRNSLTDGIYLWCFFIFHLVPGTEERAARPYLIS